MGLEALFLSVSLGFSFPLFYGLDNEDDALSMKGLPVWITLANKKALKLKTGLSRTGNLPVEFVT